MYRMETGAVASGVQVGWVGREGVAVRGQQEGTLWGGDALSLDRARVQILDVMLT